MTPKTTKLQVFSDGTPLGTRVFTESGEEITGITSVTFHHDANHIPLVMLSLIEVPVSVIGKNIYEENDGTRKLRLIDAKTKSKESQRAHQAAVGAPGEQS